MARRLFIMLAAALFLALPSTAAAQETPEDIVATLNAYWAGVFAQEGLPYTPPAIQAVTGPTDTPCGPIDVYIAPGAYCDANATIYYVPNAQENLGDLWAVLGHEFGHHVLRELGSPGHSLESELTADCLGGAALRAAVDSGNASPGLAALGLRLTQGSGDAFVPVDGQVPHGPGNFRSLSFMSGYNGGPSACGVGL